MGRIKTGRVSGRERGGEGRWSKASDPSLQADHLDPPLGSWVAHRLVHVSFQLGRVAHRTYREDMADGEQLPTGSSC